MHDAPADAAAGEVGAHGAGDGDEDEEEEDEEEEREEAIAGAVLRL